MEFSPCSNTSLVRSQDGRQAPFPVIDLEDLRRISGPVPTRPKKNQKLVYTSSRVQRVSHNATRVQERTSGPQLPTARRSATGENAIDEIHSGGGDTRSTSGKSVNVGCAASGFAGPPKSPAICTRVGVGCGLKLKVDTQQTVERGIENGSSCLEWWAPTRSIIAVAGRLGRGGCTLSFISNLKLPLVLYCCLDDSYGTRRVSSEERSSIEQPFHA